LIVERQYVVFKNTAKEVPIVINDVFTSSPEIIIMDDQFPVTLEPGQQLEITLLMIPESLDLI
jgi:hypothetical protein